MTYVQSNINPIEYSTVDGSIVDAFGRIRVSNPQTLFDSKNIFNDPDIADTAENIPLFYDNAETSGSGTSTSYEANKSQQTLSVSGSIQGTRVRQTKMRFNYQPGKSQLIFMTFNLNGVDAGICKREGIFDENNGIFLELSNGGAFLVKRTNVSGTVVDYKVPQSNWNIETFLNTGGKSGTSLDFTKTHILCIDYEWLGVGRIRIGFNINGSLYYAHEFNHANNEVYVYMQTPNLPLRSEIASNGTATSGSYTISQICSSVISEGGSQDLGVTRYISTGGTAIACSLENSIYVIGSLKLKPAYIGSTVKLLSNALQIQTASDKIEWFWLLNPTLASGSLSYNNLKQSAIAYAVGDGTQIVTPSTGYQIGLAGFAESGGNQTGAAGSVQTNINNALLLGSLIDGTPDELVLCARPVGGSTGVEVEASIMWRELT